MKRDKKRAAAVSAVLAYIREEEAQQAVSAEMPPPGKMVFNAWGIGGRQSQMQLRSLMQLKGFHGARFR